LGVLAFLDCTVQLLDFAVLVFDNVVESFDFLSDHFHLVVIVVDSLAELVDSSFEGLVFLTQSGELFSLSGKLLGLTIEFRKT
jgi:hypothetical protein